MTVLINSMTIIMPSLNEAEAIGQVIRELKRNGYNNIVVVDGHSTDGTDEVAMKLGAKVIEQKGNGKGAALLQAFNHDGVNDDVIVMIDADGSMSAKEIPLFLQAIISGADLAKGSRFLPGGFSEDMSFIRRVGNLFFVSLVNWLWSTNYTDLCYGFVAFGKEAFEKMRRDLKSKNFEIETEICIKAKKIGLKVVEIPSVELRRSYGESNLNAFKDGFSILRIILGEFFNRNRKGKKHRVRDYMCRRRN